MYSSRDATSVVSVKAGFRCREVRKNLSAKKEDHSATAPAKEIRGMDTEKM